MRDLVLIVEQAACLVQVVLVKATLVYGHDSFEVQLDGLFGLLLRRLTAAGVQLRVDLRLDSLVLALLGFLLLRLRLHELVELILGGSALTAEHAELAHILYLLLVVLLGLARRQVSYLRLRHRLAHFKD